MSIFEAIRNQDIKTVETILLEEEFDVNSFDSLGCTPLSVALKYDEYKIAGLLLSNGADINAIEKETGFSPLHHACIDCDSKAASFLVNLGANVNLPSDGNFTPLMIACELGCLDIAKLLVCNGANLNVQNEFGYTPLIYSVTFNRPEVAFFLLCVGADHEIQTKEGLTAFKLAKKHGLSEVIKVFEDHFIPKLI